MKHKIALLGSTGSIGRQTLDIIRTYSDRFEVTTLTSNNNWELLAAQAVEFEPDSVVIAKREHYPALCQALADHPIKVYAGDDAVAQVTEGGNVDTVVNALVGYAGLQPTVSALRAGKKLALANKESLVVAGEMVMNLSREYNAPIIPVDSEHSAIFQCLVGEVSPIANLILTASGGPFLDTPAEKIRAATPAEALDHPNWDMGAKITIDSATLLNKGFEVIEAKWLFGIEADRIKVLVHPQSIIHSMVEFQDGAIKAQLGNPDMHLPIQYALTYPYRWPIENSGFSFADYPSFTFREPDLERFPALALAFDSLRAGGNRCCVLNAANEVAVAAFLEGRIAFGDIPRTLEYVLGRFPQVACSSVDHYRESNDEARSCARSYIGSQVR